MELHITFEGINEKDTENRTGRNKSVPKKDSRKIDEEAQLNKHMAKMEINKDEKEADRILSQAVEGKMLPTTKEQRAMVFKILSELKSKARGKPLTVKEVRGRIPLKELSEEDFQAVLQFLSNEGLMVIELDKIFM